MKFLMSVVKSREFGLLVLLAVVFAFFGQTAEGFLDSYNLLDRSRHWIEIGLLAVPMTFIIATGGIDLSVGSLMALAGIVMGMCHQRFGWPFPAALAACVATGVAGGMLNGVAISRLRIPALVATLGTLALYRGLAMGISQAQPFGGMPMGFTDWGSITTFGFGDWQAPWTLPILIGFVLAGELLLRKSPAGRWSVQMGENLKAARFSAVPVQGMLFGLYTAMGATCALAAMVYTARYATARPGAAEGIELEAIAAVIIGGTRITGGNGSVLGTCRGVVLLGVLRYGMEISGTPQRYQIILIGVLVIATAILNEWIARRGVGVRK